MSVITDVILTFSPLEMPLDSDKVDSVYALMDDINKWLTERGYGAFGVSVDIYAGGNKYMVSPVFLGAFNHLDLAEFQSFIFNLPWKKPENVQLFIEEEDDDVFTMLMKKEF